MKKVIVTGGLGFIGSNLIESLLKKKYRVLNIDKKSYASNFYNTKDYEKNNNYEFFNCDLVNAKKISKKIFNFQPNIIFNLAAETHVDRSIDDPKIFITSNIIGTFNLLEAFKKFYKKSKKSRLIHISTDEVYGDVLKSRSKENSAYLPSSPYAASKASSDHLVYSYFKTFNLPIIISNCSNNYGPKQHPEKLIPKLIYNLIHNKDLPIYGKGVNSREWLFVKDHCDALILISQKGKVGNFYNIGSNKNLTNIEISKKLLKIAKSKFQTTSKIKFVKDRPGHDYRYALNSKKIHKELGWYPKTNFKNGINITFEWYLNNLSYYKKFSTNDIISRQGLKND
tara:strand:+ start:857 stop:1876 length:1020 start_codon:yes stop_codon:yes gene_type:complete